MNKEDYGVPLKAVQLSSIRTIPIILSNSQKPMAMKAYWLLEKLERACGYRL